MDCGEEEMGEREFGIEKRQVFFIFGPPFSLVSPHFFLHTNVYSLHVFLSIFVKIFLSRQFSFCVCVPTKDGYAW